MISPNRPTSRIRLFFHKTIRTAVLLSLVVIAATALASTNSSARAIGQRLIARAAAIVTGAPEAMVAPASHSLASEFEAAEESTTTIARRGHTATRLSDGRVLIAGGENAGGGYLNEAEIFDPASGTFSVVGFMGTGRSDHAAVKLADGKVLITGGQTATGETNTTEVFDPATGTFVPGPSMSVARAGHSATLFADGPVFIAGGDANGTAEVFDSGTFNVVGVNLTTVRSKHSAALLLDGRVLLVGGRDSNGSDLSSLEIFDPADQSFSSAGDLKLPRVLPHLRVLFDGKVQIIGGNNDESMEIYDPVNQQLGAYAHVLPATDTCTGLRPGILASQTRAALFHNGQSDALLDRSGHTISELPGSNQALVAGGANSSEIELDSTSVLASSPASISTDKLDYAPGETVNISGRGWQPGETVRLKIHEDPHTPQERGLDVVADADGNFVGTYVVQDYDLSMKFIVSARGLTSGWSAQTTFTDGNVTLHLATGQGVTQVTVAFQIFGTAGGGGTVNNTCSGSPSSSGTVTLNAGGTVNIPGFGNNNLSVRLGAVTIVSPLNSGRAFDKWTSGDKNTDSGVDLPGTPTPCISANPSAGTNGNITDAYAHFRIVNTAPTAASQSVTTDEDTPKLITLSGSDPDGNNLTFSIVSNPTNGTLGSIGAPSCSGTPSTCTASVTYTPNTNYNGSDSFVFKVNDGTVDSSNATVSITITSVNDAPAGADNTVTTSEDTAHTFTAAQFGFSDPNDTPANALLAVKITTVATDGKLKLNGVDVTAGQFILVADINAGKLKFFPDANESGSPYATFTFQVQDDGGTANGGVDLDQSPNTMTINVTAVNDEPSGADNTVTTNEDTAHTFTTAQFGFSDPNDTPANALAAVKITTVATDGKLKLNGVDVTAGQFILVADINAGKLKFFPDANESGSPYATFTFQVQDDGGTANGGVDLDQSSNTMTINVTAVNDEPSGADNAVTTNEDTAYTFAAAEFGFTDSNDSPANALAAVKITTVASDGKLKLNGVDVTAGQFILVADINAGKLKFFPDANESGSPYATFTFQVQDDGGTANGGVDLDQSPNTMTINITAVNDEPAGADNTVTTNEDTAYTFAAAEFGFTDPNDTPANALAAVKITTVATDGKLKLNGVDVTAGQFILVADITAGKLKFFPDANESGSPYATFTFQVQDDGGTANGGVDLDQSPNTMIINVTAVNDAPSGADNTVVTNEDTAYTFAAVEFGFTDPNDSPANALAAVKITAVATDGKLKLNSVDVTAGQFVSAADINAGKLKFFPDANESGSPYATFTFQVQDDGGTANGGVDLDQSPNTMTINVTAVNDEPSGVDNTVTTNEDTPYTFAAAEFGFTDPNDTPANALAAVKITSVASDGKLKLNGVNVTAGQFIVVADIDAGNLKFFPDANESGSPYATFTFQVQDDGGTANGGVDLDQSANTMTINVTAVNDEPSGADNTVTTNEDTAYTFAAAEFGFTDPNDTPANALAAVKITTVASDGKLKLNGVDVTAGQFILVADINAGNLKFFPDANESGSPYATFTFQVQDNGGTANGGIDLDQSPNTMTINVTAVNDEPAGADNTVATNEDTPYTFAAAEFGFTDPNDSPANALAAVKITTVATDGKLKLNGVDVTAGQFILVADINAGKLKFFPDANESGSPYATFTFQVQDDGGTANGGVDLDQSPNTMTINVTAVNDEPSGADNTVTTNEDTPYTFAAAEFGFTDPNDSPANALAAVKITTVATDGKLKLNGVDVTAGQFITVADITAGNLKFFPDANESGSPYATFTFQVQDDGGTANGGIDLDQSPNTMTINVTAVNDEPSGADNAVTTNEDTAYTFAAAEFGFTDPNDTPANALAAVKITTVATDGKLKLNGVDVAPGQFILVADINAGKLKFFPDANESGSPYATFTFQVQDDGGTANGGVDLDQSPNTMTINVTAVNDEPSGADNTVATNEDTPYTFAAAEFGFTDPNDTPANALAAVKITTVASDGKLKLNGVDVTAGQFILVADINAGNLKFFPDANESGSPYATFTFQVQDDGGTANGGIDLDQSPNTMTINVTAVNDEPAGADNTVTTNEDTAYTFAAADFGFTDPSDTPPNAFSAVNITTVATDGKLKLNGVDVTPGQFILVADITAGKLKFFPDANENGTPYATFTFQVQDNGGTANGGIDLDQSPNTMTINVTPVNDPPIMNNLTIAPGLINENDSAVLNGSFSDADPGDTHTVVISWGDGSPNSTINLAAGVFTFSANHQYKDDNPTNTASDINTVSVTVCDGGQDGNEATSGDNACAGQSTTITVRNVAPVITTANGPTTPQPAGSSVTVTASFTDVGTQDTHTCSVSWDDGTTSNGTVSETNGSGTCTASHTFTSPGVYSVVVTITDDDTGSASRPIELQYIVIFDPNSGFVTGGGWIISPAGACQLTPGCASSTGKANFGFVSKYKKGSNIPDGQTEFQFQAGDINFHSSAYDYGSLVVSGFKAQYKGTGDINGVPGYKFVLTAYDGDINGGGGVDKFRIKITKNGIVVYDNRIGASDDIDLANPTAISGGSIVIHK